MARSDVGAPELVIAHACSRMFERGDIIVGRKCGELIAPVERKMVSRTLKLFGATVCNIARSGQAVGFRGTGADGSDVVVAKRPLVGDIPATSYPRLRLPEQAFDELDAAAPERGCQRLDLVIVD